MSTPFSVVALAAAVPHLVAARADRPPVLDGKLDDAVWAKAPASEVFTQKVPVDAKPPSERTVVRILHDDDAIYVGVDCPQKAEVIARLTRRDRQVEADSVTVVLDTRGDGKTAYEFSVNAAGVLADALRFNDTDSTQDWDENWEAAVARTKEGWSAELRIPLRALRFPSAPIQSWGLQVRRYVSALQELDEWAHIPRDAGGEVSRYGRLDNLVGLKSKSPFELRPFVVARLRHYDPESATLARGFAPGFAAGLDLKWHVSQALTLDATFLPDFGQVEADQVILNLSTYEIYYPEKRPFFLEGVENFSTPLQLLYTRRIGRAPPPPAVITDKPILEQIVNNPTPSIIYGAAKLTGDLGGRWSIGGLVAMTGRQTVEARAQNGTKVQRLAEPLTTYKVLRLKRELGDTSHVGMIFTAVNRLESSYDVPLLAGIGPRGKPLELCPSGDTLLPGERCFHDAYAAGVDGKWRSADGEYVATAQVVGTLIHRGPPRTLPDGTEIKSGDTGPAVALRAAKEGGKDFAGVIEYEAEGRRADFNDLGYMRRQNQSRLRISAEYRTLKPKGATLETHTGFDFLQRDNLSLENQFRGLALVNYTKFKNFWGLYSEIHVWPRHWDDREMGDGASLERGALWGFEVWLASDSRKRVYAELWTQTHFIENGMGFQGDGKLSIKVLPQWDVDLLPNWVYARGEPRYFGSQGNAYLFGRQRAQSLSLTLRSTYTFTPRLTLQAYAQAILESVHFSDYHWSPARGRGALIHLGDLRPAAFPVLNNPDYEAGTINASLVGRWEWRLGSTLFLVYTHSQSTARTPRFGDGAGFDFALVKPRAAEDALQMKLSYWWG